MRDKLRRFIKGNISWLKNKKGIFIGEKSPSWKGGKPKCSECGKPLSAYKSTKCSNCFHNGRKKENHPMYGIHRYGKNSPNWKGGLIIDKTHHAKWTKEYRHRKGISKNYGRERSCTLSVEERKERKRLNRKKWKYSFRNAGKLSIQTIQLVYEDNIKKYGTMTCYLCENPIVFDMKDHLEHKTPLSRGGTNEYNNLGIACQKCNCRKGRKTEEEFRQGEN